MRVPPSGPADGAARLPGQRTPPGGGGGAGTTRERRAVDAFTGLFAALAAGPDVVELLEGLAGRCAEVLDVASAGLLLADARGDLHVVGASSADARDLELLQTQRTEGPGRDCYLTGRPVRVGDLTEHAGRWPRSVAAAGEAGVTRAHAMPLRARTRTLGALALFGRGARRLDDQDLAVAQALADVASVALTRGLQREDDVGAHLQTALDDRVALERAKGFLAHRVGLSTSEASDVLRRFARERRLGLAEVSRAVVAMTLPAAALVDRVDEGDDRA